VATTRAICGVMSARRASRRPVSRSTSLNMFSWTTGSVPVARASKNSKVGVMISR
jgi:hypothetical protein